MSLILRQNVRGLPLAPPVTLDRRRRRLSTIVARHGDRSRPIIVSLHRKGDIGLLPTDETVRLRKSWRDTLVGPDDVVAITTLPLGSAMSGAGGRSAGKQIGMAVGMLALAVAMPYAVGALGGAFVGAAGSLSVLGKVAVAALTAGVAIGASFLLNKAAKTKDKEAEAKAYSVSGGGNLPRAGERIPRLYGRAWIEPDLTQPPYLNYVGDLGDEQELYQRMTLTLGYCTVETVKVGDAVMWTRNGGVQPAFAGAQVEIIEPGATSNLVPAAVISSQSVTSQELPRPDSTVQWSGPFPLTPIGRHAHRVQLDYSLPQGVSSTFTNKNGSSTGPMNWGVEFQIAEIDNDDNVIGPWTVLHANGEHQNTTKPIRQSHWIVLDEAKRFAVRARNTQLDKVPENDRVTDVQNAVLWDGMRAWLPETIIRPHVTELAIRVRASKALGVTAFNAIKVEAIARLPVWTGGGWSLQETRKAVDAFGDIMRGTVNGWTYGAGCADSDLDLARIFHYRNLLTTFDTFDGVIRGPVSVYEAAETVLGVIRAQPTRIGNAWSLTRDEARLARKHTITRRQIVRGTSASSFDLSLMDGSAHVIVEYSPNADPSRRGEAPKFFGSPSITPRRFQMAGVSTYEHAYMLATWIAACAYYRREKRTFTTELESRLIRRGDPALVDAWFMGDSARAAGVLQRAGFTLTLDTDIEVAADSYMYVRDRVNREFGPVRVTQGSAPNVIIANTDDVAAVGAFYSPPVAWGDLWQADGDEMTSVLIGPLVEIAEPYLIQSIEPQGRYRAEIEAIVDNRQVWSALGEAAPPNPPVPGVEDILGPTVPVVPWVRASAMQHTTALNMDWAVGAARGGVRYIIELSYDLWATADLVSDGPVTSGTYQIRHVEDQEVYVRAYAISATGVVGPRIFSSFRTFKPIISSDVASIQIEIENLTAQLRKDVQSVADLGEGTVRRLIKELDAKVEVLAADAMQAAVAEDSHRTALVARTGRTVAALTEERNVRTSENEATTSLVTSALSRLTLAEDEIDGQSNVITGQASAIQELNTGVTNVNNALTAQSNQITTLDSRINTADGNIAGQASAIGSLGSTVTSINGAVTAQAESIGVLQSRVGSHTATLTTLGSSVNGLSVQYGVVGEIDGVSGGYVMTGMRRLDGSVYFSLGVRGDLIVDGTIYGHKLAATNIIAASAQIGNLVVDNIHVRNGAISQVTGSQGGLSATVGLNIRSGGVVILGWYSGSQGSILPNTAPWGALNVYRDGSHIRSISTNTDAFGSGYFLLQTSTVHIDYPGPGWHEFTVNNTNAAGYGYVNIVVIELSK